jgi:glycosyltransferase involved in cell wall biosynthesis
MAPKSSPLLTLSMIVKDEAATIERTLASVRPHIDRYVIADTGSTDGTADVVRRAMDGVEGEVVTLPFVDFATTRNAALERAIGPTPFVLWLDAEDELAGGAALREFLRKQVDARGPEHDAYYVRIELGAIFDSARVLRAHSGWRFRGAVHEVLTHSERPPPSIRVPGVTIAHRRADDSAERSRARWERDVGLLQRAIELDPSDARATFYLGQTLSWLDRRAESRRVLQRRVALGGWAEEVYQAQMTIADLASRDGLPTDALVPLFLAAHETAPHRAEPLVEIALRYDREKRHALTLLYARRAYELPLPKDDRLFVDASAYAWRAADLVASSAYWVGAFELGEEAARRAAKRCPDDARLQQNLAFYLARKAKRRG